MNPHIPDKYNIKQFGILNKHQFGFYLEPFPTNNYVPTNFELISFNLDVIIFVLFNQNKSKSKLKYIVEILEWCNYQIVKNQNRTYKDLYLKIKYLSAKSLVESNLKTSKDLGYKDSFINVITEPQFASNFKELAHSKFYSNLFLLLRINYDYSPNKQIWLNILQLLNIELAKQIVMPTAFLNDTHFKSYEILNFLKYISGKEIKTFESVISNYRNMMFKALFSSKNFVRNAILMTRSNMKFGLIKKEITIYQTKHTKGLNEIYNLTIFNSAATNSFTGKHPDLDTPSIFDTILRANFPFFMINKRISIDKLNDFLNQKIKIELSPAHIQLFETDIKIAYHKNKLSSNTKTSSKSYLNFEQQTFEIENRFEILNISYLEREMYLLLKQVGNSIITLNIEMDLFLVLSELKKSENKKSINFHFIHKKVSEKLMNASLKPDFFYIKELLNKKLLLKPIQSN